MKRKKQGVLSYGQRETADPLGSKLDKLHIRIGINATENIISKSYEKFFFKCLFLINPISRIRIL